MQRTCGEHCVNSTSYGVRNDSVPSMTNVILANDHNTFNINAAHMRRTCSVCPASEIWMDHSCDNRLRDAYAHHIDELAWHKLPAYVRLTCVLVAGTYKKTLRKHSLRRHTKAYARRTCRVRAAYVRIQPSKTIARLSRADI